MGLIDNRYSLHLKRFISNFLAQREASFAKDSLLLSFLQHGCAPALVVAVALL